MLKSYEELRKIDITPYCEERDGFLYLNWARCIALLHEHGAEKAYWEPIENEKTGNSLRPTEEVFTDKSGVSNRCYETKIKVVIDDNIYYMQTPVLNGKNPVKDNSMNQLRTWNSMSRAFVKCVAINTGLGFDLWLKEETGPFATYIPEQQGIKASEAQIKAIKSIGKKHKLDLDKWIIYNGKTWDTLTDADAGNMLNTLKEKYGDE